MPRLADIGKTMQPVARSAFCAVSRALAAGLMRPSSAKPTNCFLWREGLRAAVVDLASSEELSVQPKSRWTGGPIQCS